MRNSRLMISGILLAIMVVGLSGCKIISASPDLGTIIDMKPGDKVLFKVVGPVNTLTTNCVWTINNSETNEVVSEGKNEFELNFNADSKLSNKENIVVCEYQSFQYYSCGEGCGGLMWRTIDSRKWIVRTNPNSDTIITGYYIIEDDSDLQQLKGYTTVTGSLIIGPSIENLDGLENLTTIGGLKISGNRFIKDLTALESITSISGDLTIYGNIVLTSLTGLENITSVGGTLRIGYYDFGNNPALTSLAGLQNLTSIGGDLGIGGNDALTNLSGLENLASVSGGLSISDNAALTTLSGLGNITSVGGDLSIDYNASLTNLSGLDNLTSVGRYLEIDYNVALTSLSGLENITSLSGDLRICGDAALTNLSGLENITSIGGNLIIGDLGGAIPP